jgi:hypothetical protein
VSRQSPRPSRIGRAVAVGSSATTGAIPALVYVNAPWWAIALVAALAALGIAMSAAATIAEHVFPQESADRRDWWRDLWQHRASRHPARADTAAPNPPPDTDGQLHRRRRDGISPDPPPAEQRELPRSRRADRREDRRGGKREGKRAVRQGSAPP